MSSEKWETRRLGEICTKIGSGATPRGGQDVYLDDGPVALIRSQNVLDFSFSSEGLVYIDEPQAALLSNVKVEAGDVLLNITGDSVARVCQAPRELLPARVNQHVAIIRPDRTRLDAQFLKYFLLNPRFKNQMLAYSFVGATRKALTKGMIEGFDIALPPLFVQRRIASILSALDDKIELNRQTSATLEAIAQAIFKAWFVDFEFPGDTGERVESELGLIPAGWRVLPIGELFEYVVGGDWGKEEAEEDYSNLCVVIRGTDINDIRRAQIDEVPKRYVQSSKLQRRQLVEGDIVFEISGGSKDQATGRNLLLTAEILELFSEKVIPASFCRLIRARDMFHAVFLGTYLRMFYDSGGTWDFQLQSTGISNFQFSDFQSRHTICLPPSEILDRFRNMVMPIYRLMGENISQSIALIQIRDTLLPKLMSGDIGL